MKKIFIFGIGGFAKLLRWYVDRYSSVKVSAFIVDSEFRTDEQFDNLAVISTSEFLEKYKPEDAAVFLALGYKKMNDVRKEKYLFFKSRGYELPNFIHPTVCNESDEIGQANIILEGAVLSPFVRIGDANIIWNSASISQNSRIGSYNALSVGSKFAGSCTCGNNCFVGANATIKNGVKIADYTFIGASTYINANTADGAAYLASGSPRVKRFSSFDIIEMMS